MSLNESIIEDAALEWYGELGYAVGHGPHPSPGESAAERESFGEVVLMGHLREAIRRLNPGISEDARDETLRKMLRVGTPSLTKTNRAFHRMLRDGVPVEYTRSDGNIAGDHAANNWFVVNQSTVIARPHYRRPDIVVCRRANHSSAQERHDRLDTSGKCPSQDPPDLQEEAVKPVMMQQAELLCANWV